MALTELQQAKCRLWLGYMRGKDLNPHLEYRFDALNSSEESIVVDTLTKLDATDDTVAGLATDNVLGVHKVDEIETKDGDMTREYTDWQRRLISRLESVFAVKRAFDVFSEDGAAGGGGLIPLG